MRLILNFPYRRRMYAYSQGDHDGTFVFNQDFVKAAAQYGGLDGITVLLDAYPPTSKGGWDQGLEELKRELAGFPLDIRSVEDISTIDDADLVFFTAGIYAGPITQIRPALKGSGFPVATQIHSIDETFILFLYTAALLTFQDGDAIVVSSGAGEVAVRNLFEQVCENLAIVSPAKKPLQATIHRIPLGVDTDFLRPLPRNQAREVLGLPLDEPVILYVGRLSQDLKADLDPLLWAFAQLSSQTPMTLVLAGSDPSGYSRMIETRAQDYGIADKIKLILNFPYFLKPTIYAACDVCVAPSDNIQETFGLSLTEAMACGRPVIASDWSGYRDLIVNDHTGYLVPSLWPDGAADRLAAFGPLCSYAPRRHFLARHTAIDVAALLERLRTLVMQRPLSEQMGRAGRERALEHYGWKTIIPTHVELWKEQLRMRTASQFHTRMQARLDYSRAFARFATSRSSEVSIVVGPRPLSQFSFKGQALEDAAKLIEICTRHPGRTLTDLNPDNSPLLDSTIMTLLKSGFLCWEHIPTR